MVRLFFSALGRKQRRKLIPNKVLRSRGHGAGPASSQVKGRVRTERAKRRRDNLVAIIAQSDNDSILATCLLQRCSRIWQPASSAGAYGAQCANASPLSPRPYPLLKRNYTQALRVIVCAVFSEPLLRGLGETRVRPSRPTCAQKGRFVLLSRS